MCVCVCVCACACVCVCVQVLMKRKRWWGVADGGHVSSPVTVEWSQRRGGGWLQHTLPRTHHNL